MAFRDTAKAPNFIQFLPKHRDNVFYNTDGWVGPLSRQNTSVRASFQASNKTDDVMLVQHFLKSIGANPHKFSRPFIPPRDRPVMFVDGKFGEITRTWIEKFQVHLHNIGRPVLRDGVCDRVLNGQSVSPKSGRVFTLAMLNVAMGQVTDDAGWDTWWNAPDVPPLLRQSIRAPATFF